MPQPMQLVLIITDAKRGAHSAHPLSNLLARDAKNRGAVLNAPKMFNEKL